MTSLGQFRIHECANNLRLICYGPRDLAEARSGVPQAAFAVWEPDKMVFDATNLAAFLNAAVAASHGDFAPMNKLCPPQKTDAA